MTTPPPPKAPRIASQRALGALLYQVSHSWYRRLSQGIVWAALSVPSVTAGAILTGCEICAPVDVQVRCESGRIPNPELEAACYEDLCPYNGHAPGCVRLCVEDPNLISEGTAP